MAGPSYPLRRCFFVLALLALLCLYVSFAADHHFEGFDTDDVADDEEAVTETLDHPPPIQLTRTHSDPPPPDREQEEDSKTSQPSDLPQNPASNGLEYWDEDEFEGIPEEQSPEAPKITENATPGDLSSDPIKTAKPQKFSGPRSYTVEIVCVSFLIMFTINFFTGKRENENIALAWAAKFGKKDSIFDKNFSLVGVGEGDDPPLLLKEEQNVFKFYASGRRYCSGLLATMELQSRHDLISRLCNWVMRGRDEISFEVYMNEEAMDQVVFAVARRKAAKGMQKEVRDLQRYGSLLSGPPGGRKWVAEELAVISESKEVAGDLITEAVLDQVFGERAFEKFGKGFISMHFSDQHSGTTTHKKMLLFKFALPDAKNMDDMSRLVALIPYYIDLIGRYKLSSQARSKTESARSKAAQEVYKEQQNARQEALQKRKADRKKMLEEAEAKLGAEAIRKKESKDRARQAKKAMPRVRMTRAH